MPVKPIYRFSYVTEGICNRRFNNMNIILIRQAYWRFLFFVYSSSRIWINRFHPFASVY